MKKETKDNFKSYGFAIILISLIVFGCFTIFPNQWDNYKYLWSTKKMPRVDTVYLQPTIIYQFGDQKMSVHALADSIMAIMDSTKTAMYGDQDVQRQHLRAIIWKYITNAHQAGTITPVVMGNILTRMVDIR